MSPRSHSPSLHSFTKSRLVRGAFGPVLLGLALSATGCNKKDEKPTDKVTAAEPKSKPSKRPPKKPKVDEELVALGKVVKTEEDFEEAAEKQIVADNLESEIDKLEQEIAPAATQ